MLIFDNIPQILPVKASIYMTIVRAGAVHAKNGLIWRKKVCFDFALAVVLCSIGAPDIPKNFCKRSKVKNMVFEPHPFLPWEI